LPEGVRGRYRRSRSCARRCCRRSPPRTSWSAGPGSSTLAEATAFGLPLVVVPYPHAAGHQRANARELVEAGAARVVDDEAFDAACAARRRDAARRRGRAPAMSAAARSLGRPGAAEAVARLILAVAERRPLPDQAAVERLSRGAAA
jgi:hypothetical protein